MKLIPSKKLYKKVWLIIDLFLAPFVYLSGALLYKLKRNGLIFGNLKICKKTLFGIGVFPILDDYYEPLFNPKHLKHPLSEDRALPGIDFNIKEQLDILKRFNSGNELLKIPLDKSKELDFFYRNGMFGAGDADYFYNIIRLYKPKKIIEIGSGYSTLLAIKAIEQNKKEDPHYYCEQICIEPYRCPWLEKLNIKIVRDLVENIDKSIFMNLGSNDILFIDSSHIIRPQGDVLFEYLEVLPILKEGVLVHVHDIFTPKDYPANRLFGLGYLINEQYLVEALLTSNKEYRVVGALNYLKHKHFNELSSKCPFLLKDQDAEPSSFWIIKN